MLWIAMSGSLLLTLAHQAANFRGGFVIFGLDGKVQVVLQIPQTRFTLEREIARLPRRDN